PMGEHDLILGLGPTLVGNRTIIVQLLLVLGLVGVVSWLFVKRGAKQLAVRRPLIIAFAVFAVLAVLFPGSLSRVANLVGGDRGGGGRWSGPVAVGVGAGAAGVTGRVACRHQSRPGAARLLRSPPLAGGGRAAVRVPSGRARAGRRGLSGLPALVPAGITV